MRAWIRACLAGTLLVSAGCGPTVDLQKGLQVSVVNAGWLDTGVSDGKTKLVPILSFTLKNVSDQKLTALQVNGVFRRVTDPEEWSSRFIPAGDSSGLAPSAATPTIKLIAPLGYTGSDQTRQEILNNSQFVDAKVELFAKYGSTQWKRLGEYPITRQLITE